MILALQDGTYSLIHIPLEVYPALLQPILRLLIPQTQSINPSTHIPEEQIPGLAEDTRQHVFLNISVTPIEVSVVCHSSWAETVFRPFLDGLPKAQAEAVSISADTYMVLSIISAGLDAGGRVMELSSPLALAGVPIFFITTYYSDFILVPTKERETVVQALSTKGFELSDQHKFVNQAAYTFGNTPPNSSPPGSPLPSNVQELQERALDLLQKRSVQPLVDNSLELVQCSGREVTQLNESIMVHRASTQRKSSAPELSREGWIEGVDAKLYLSIVSALASTPKFLSLTLAQEDPPSLLLDKELLPLFGDTLIGDKDATLVPIFLDLVSLPFEVTGIVCGVAGRLVQDMQMTETSELCYLSTARASAVILPDLQARRAKGILDAILSQEHSESEDAAMT